MIDEKTYKIASKVSLAGALFYEVLSILDVIKGARPSNFIIMIVMFMVLVLSLLGRLNIRLKKIEVLEGRINYLEDELAMIKEGG